MSAAVKLVFMRCPRVEKDITKLQLESVLFSQCGVLIFALAPLKDGDFSANFAVLRRLACDLRYCCTATVHKIRLLDIRCRHQEREYSQNQDDTDECKESEDFEDIVQREDAEKLEESEKRENTEQRDLIIEQF
eukprot:IDg9323t1